MSTPADPVEVLAAIANARALRYQQGELDLHEAVDGAWAAALKLGLVDANQVQAILAAAFEQARGDLKAAEPASFPGDEYEGLSSTFARACQLADAQHAARPVLEHIPIVARDGVPSAEALQRVYERHLKRPAASTIAAAEYLLSLHDRDRLRAWLIEKSPTERGLLLAHFANKKGRAA